MQEKRIFVSGGGGYVGSRLIQKLVEDHYSVICFDRFTKGINKYKQTFNSSVELIIGDIRTIDPTAIKNIDTIIDLSAKSKDTEGSSKYETREINQIGRNNLAKIAKKRGVRRYIRISGTSVYGQQKDIVDEETKVNPVTEYAKANYDAEKEVLKLNDTDYTVVVLRFPSVFGVSPNMRWDQAINSMIADAYEKRKIFVRGKSHRRPFLHISDAVESCIISLEISKEIISGQTFNVGSNKLNYRLDELAREIKEHIKIPINIELSDSPDNQSHMISFNKIRDKLGFEAKCDIKCGVDEIFQALEKGLIIRQK